jgi:hypothetical protein
MENREKLEMIASLTIQECEDFYKLVDFLNRTLKDKNLMFGLRKIKGESKMTIYIYEV